MNLKILLPTEVFLEETITKLNAESLHGAFGLRPRHIDFTAILVPGILAFETEGGQETFLGIDEGVLVKQGAEVLVSTRRAVRSADLEHLHRTVEEDFTKLDERERKARSALARLESSFIQRFMEIDEGR